jgi:hypothetical protein
VRVVPDLANNESLLLHDCCKSLCLVLNCWLPNLSSGVDYDRQVMATEFCDLYGSGSDVSIPGLSTESDTESDREHFKIPGYFQQVKASIDFPPLKSPALADRVLPIVKDSICEDEATRCTLDTFETYNAGLCFN